MNRLFDSMATGSQIALFKVVEEGLTSALKGKTDQFFYNIDHYLNAVPDTKRDMIVRAHQRLEELARLDGYKKVDTMFEGVTDDYFAIFTILENYVTVGIDMEKEGYPSALYTRNLGLLENLERNNRLEGDINKLRKALTSKKTIDSLKTGTFVTVRLDVIGQQNGEPLFKGVVPQSNLEIGLGKKHVIIPVPFFHMFDNMMYSYFREVPFTFTKQSIVGPVSHNVSIGQNVVRQAFEGSDENLVESKIRKIEVGYDVLKLRYFAYDLESSLHSLGIASFRPEMLDSLRPLAYGDLDKSRHNVNFDHLRGIFKTKVKSLNRFQVEFLKFIDIESFATTKDRIEAILVAADNKSDTEIYAFMKNRPDVFGDIEEALRKREVTTPRFLKGMTPITLPQNEEERIALIYEMLDTGVVKFTANTKGGYLFERSGTNNKAILERMLGKDYVKNFESIRIKLYHVRDLLTNGEIKTKLDLEKTGVEYNLLDYVDQKEYFSGNPQDAIQAIEVAIEGLKQKAAARAVSKSSILYRNPNATEIKDFYGSVNVNNIISVEYAKY